MLLMMKLMVAHKYNVYDVYRYECSNYNAACDAVNTNEEKMKVYVLLLNKRDTYFLFLMSFCKENTQRTRIHTFQYCSTRHHYLNMSTLVSDRTLARTTRQQKNTKTGHEKRKVVTDSKEQHVS